ncbi:hypothetical protein ACQEUU_06490 [Nonomuraea sp. CA-218870]|uniref:hypothetical protein n=1 Tax=Nonomuraea sp. CA-218870 TaxID=3239998 RepID=UPI003D8EF530
MTSEMAVAEDAGYFEAASRYVPHLLGMLRQVVAYQGPTAEDPAVLGAISALTHPEVLARTVAEFFAAESSIRVPD